MARLNENGKWIGAKSKSGYNEKAQKYAASMTGIIFANIVGIIIFLILLFLSESKGQHFKANDYIMAICSCSMVGWICNIFIGKGAWKVYFIFTYVLSLIPLFVASYVFNKYLKLENQMIENILASVFYILGSVLAYAYNRYRLNGIYYKKNSE